MKAICKWCTQSFEAASRKRQVCDSCKKDEKKRHYAKNSDRLKALRLEYYYAHKEEISARIKPYLKKYNKENSERRSQWAKQHRRDIRETVFSHYGRKCACCGEGNYEFLAIDHVDGGGRQHMMKIPGHNLANWIIANGFPDGFRILCHNCNQSMGAYGYCPHQEQLKGA